MGKKAYRVVVRGKVQHVGFRFWTQCLAIKLNVQGYVKNLSDGESVELEAEGKIERVEKFLSFVREEHPYAHVLSFEKEEIELKGYTDFSIIR
ncbi:MAG: acylphosphatase [Treponema sp.]